MLVSHQERPRELKWYHAGPMLYGDWGTSRFYVLGLAFYFALYSSFWYILGVGLLVAAVGWAYTVVCRVYPDGGGVYSAARQISPLLSVIGALLLFADYIVTASLSAMDGMHYLQIRELVLWAGATHNPDVAELYVRAFAIFGIFLIGVINFIGPKKAGTFALMMAFPLFLAGESDLSWAAQAHVAAWITGIPGLVLSYVSWAMYAPLGVRALREGRADRAAAAATP